MNIFVLDLDVKKCAEYHNNRHCVKMILEQTQILCGVHHVINPTSEIPYRLTHKNHPCSIWARECIENYVWLVDMTLELCKEYTYRYGKRHKTQDVLEWCVINIPDLPEKGNLTPFALAMPDEYKTNCPVESYRNYYNGAKKDLGQWKNREIPFWFEENELSLVL